MSWDILIHPFTLGLALGLALAAVAWFKALHHRSELKRYRGHLSDRLEIEADAMRSLRDDKARLEKENENLRVKVARLTDDPDRSARRDLDVMLRAERQMLVGVPGFAGPWESAKQQALAEVEEEEAGRSMPRRVIAKLFGRGDGEAAAGHRSLSFDDSAGRRSS